MIIANASEQFNEKHPLNQSDNSCLDPNTSQSLPVNDLKFNNEDHSLLQLSVNPFVNTHKTDMGAADLTSDDYHEVKDLYQLIPKELDSELTIE